MRKVINLVKTQQYNIMFSAVIGTIYLVGLVTGMVIGK